MSKEIKFRVWSYEDKEYRTDCNLTQVFNSMTGMPATVYGEEGDRFDIEQYTGLKDKNGKEIYEGDIVKAKIQGFWETGPNTICEGKATWNLEVIYNEIRYMDVFHILGSKNAPDRIYYLFEDKLSDIEVIGNMHENPELLGGKE